MLVASSGFTNWFVRKALSRAKIRGPCVPSRVIQIPPTPIIQICCCLQAPFEVTDGSLACSKYAQDSRREVHSNRA